MTTYTFTFQGRTATVLRPENPNGEWIWKTEFFYAFDDAERALLDRGYTRVYYKISDMYGSPRATELMYDFYRYVTRAFQLKEQTFLFGFSRGGLYAFSFAMAHPTLVRGIYLDAPVLDMRTWPPEGTLQREQVYEQFGLNAESILTSDVHPIERLQAFFSLNLPLLLVAGDADEIVPYEKNALKMYEYAKKHGHFIDYYVKAGCMHHPHSLADVTPIVSFVERHSNIRHPHPFHI